MCLVRLGLSVKLPTLPILASRGALLTNLVPRNRPILRLIPRVLVCRSSQQLLKTLEAPAAFFYS
jgi:hypothetical protein